MRPQKLTEFHSVGVATSINHHFHNWAIEKHFSSFTKTNHFAANILLRGFIVANYFVATLLLGSPLPSTWERPRSLLPSHGIPGPRHLPRWSLCSHPGCNETQTKGKHLGERQRYRLRMSWQCWSCKLMNSSIYWLCSLPTCIQCCSIQHCQSFGKEIFDILRPPYSHSSNNIKLTSLGNSVPKHATVLHRKFVVSATSKNSQLTVPPLYTIE